MPRIEERTQTREWSAHLVRTYRDMANDPVVTSLKSNASRRTTRAPRAVIADDDPSMRQAVARALRRVGYAVDVASDGEELVEVVRGTSRPYVAPDLVVSDVHMPRLSGPDAIASLAPLLENTTVVLMSGHVGESVFARARELGVFLVLEKSNAIETLCESLACCREVA
jgi:CheY-like chemotaxis protein